MRIYPIILFFICFFLLQSNLIEIKEVPYKASKVEKGDEEKNLNEDSKTIKNLLIKVLDSHIKEENFINKHFINKTIDQMSKQLAVYYNQIINIKDDPDKSIKIINDIISNGQAYVEAGAMYLDDIIKNLHKEYTEIENKYRTDFEYLIGSKKWKERVTLQEIVKVNELESQIKELSDILKMLNRTKLLFIVIDWVIYSKSPLAWLIRQFTNLNLS